MDVTTGLFAFWAVTTGAAVAGAWFTYFHLRQRDRFLVGLEKVQQAVVSKDDFLSQAKSLCETARTECKAAGCTLYLQPSKGETGFRRAAEVGLSAEETGPGLVRDLLAQAWDSGQVCESQYAGRWIMAIPVWPKQQGGGSMLMIWDGEHRPGQWERRLLQVVSSVASMVAPRFQEEGALTRAREEIESLQAEVAEEHQMASVGRLAAGVAHELNTPLGAVLAMVSSLQRNESDENRAKRLRIVREAVEKCKSIIEKLLVYSREPVETEQGLTFSRFVRSDANLNEVIKNTVDLLQDSLAQDKVNIKLHLQDLPTVRINSTQFSHVFNNLLINARDAMRSAGTSEPEVEIRTINENSKIRVEVSDNGPGIPDDVRKKVFQPFFTTKEVGRGTGLGLAICSEIVRKHQGSITVGGGPKGGAQFTIQLPVAN